MPCLVLFETKKISVIIDFSCVMKEQHIKHKASSGRIAGCTLWRKKRKGEKEEGGAEIFLLVAALGKGATHYVGVI